MNIDELKNTWNEEVSDEIPEINTEQKRKINLPLEKMRRNMRMEFWSTVGICIFGFILVGVYEAPFKFKFYITILVASMILVTSFFFSKFFKLYKNMSNPDMKTYDTLKDLLQQLNLNKQYYLSFYLSFIPFGICELIIFNEFLPHKAPLTDFGIAFSMIISVVLGLFGVYLFGKWWFKYFYGRHIATIERLLSEFQK